MLKKPFTWKHHKHLSFVNTCVSSFDFIASGGQAKRNFWRNKNCSKVFSLKTNKNLFLLHLWKLWLLLQKGTESWLHWFSLKAFSWRGGHIKFFFLVKSFKTRSSFFYFFALECRQLVMTEKSKIFLYLDMTSSY